jgi:hypothetical protein
MPASFRGLCSNGAAFGGAERLRPRLSAHFSALASQCNITGITGVNRVFERRAIHLLANGLLYHFAGNLHEVAFFAGALRHAAMMP